MLVIWCWMFLEQNSWVYQKKYDFPTGLCVSGLRRAGRCGCTLIFLESVCLCAICIYIGCALPFSAAPECSIHGLAALGGSNVICGLHIALRFSKGSEFFHKFTLTIRESILWIFSLKYSTDLWSLMVRICFVLSTKVKGADGSCTWGQHMWWCQEWCWCYKIKRPVLWPTIAWYNTRLCRLSEGIVMNH